MNYNKGTKMIEKLKETYTETTRGKITQKINELVDAVNELQLTVSKMENLEHLKKIGQGFKNLQDPYAEQRKWVGKLCGFWDDNCKITKHFGVLTRIDETAIIPYEAENGFWYCACEPVKPTDDIIFKE